MMTILIVEDELLELEFLQSIVQEEIQEDGTIITCSTGTQAIELARQYSPDIILLDVWLPEIDGIQALQEIIQFLPNVTTMILSACSDFAYAQKAIRLRVQEYLLKPIRPDEFRQAFRKLLNTTCPAAPSALDASTEKLRQPALTQKSEYTDVIEKTLKYIQENFNQKLSLKDVSTYVFMNPQYVSRIFKKEVGMNCIDYINKLKIEYACKLLKTTNLPAYQIALECGFSDQSYFNRVFTNQMGITPKTYRRQYHGESDGTEQSVKET